MQNVIFSYSDLALGAKSGTLDLTGSVGDLHENEHISWQTNSGATGPWATVDFDYRLFARAGLEVEFDLNGGDVDIVAPVNVDFASSTSLLSDGSVVIDTSSWGWGETMVVASGPSYDLSVDLVAELLLSTWNEKIQILPDDAGSSYVEFNIDLPDVFETHSVNGGIHQNILDISSDSEVPVWSGELGIIDIEAVIPQSIGAASVDPDDFLGNGITIADSISDPFLFGSMSFVELAAKLGSPVAAFLSNSLEFKMPGVSAADTTFDYTILDVGLDIGLSIAQEYVFTPGDIALVITNLSTGEQEQGLLGNEFSFSTPADDFQYSVSLDLSGTLSSRWGISANLSLPFTLLEADLQSGLIDQVHVGPLLEGEFPAGGFQSAPYYFINGEVVNVDFIAQSLQFTADIDTSVDLPIITSFASASGTEGSLLEFVVTLDRPAIEAVTIPFSILGVDTDSGDYTPLGALVSIAAGQSSGSAFVQTHQDADTDTESFTVHLGIPQGALTGLDMEATGTIIDDDAVVSATLPVVVGIDDALTVEGGNLSFLVHLNKPAEQDVVLNYQVQTGTASGADFNNASGTMIILQGDLTGTLVIASTQDSLVELAENFTVTLTGATNAILNQTLGATATILDDDVEVAVPQVFAVRNDQVKEGGLLSFEIVLDGEATTDVQVQYQITSITADAEDFAGRAGLVTIPAGQRSVFINVETYLDDDVDDEQIALEIIGVTGAILGSDTSATGTILDYYSPAPAQPTIVSISDGSATEGGLLNFNVALDGPAANDVVIRYALDNITSEDGDFHPIGNYELVIRRGESGGVIQVSADHDSDYAGETFTLRLTDVVGTSAILQSTATGTIEDDDTPSDIIVQTGVNPVTEGGEMVFTFDLDYNPSFRTVTVFYHIDGGTASEGTDFTEQVGSGSFQMQSDSVTTTVRVNILGDGFVEGDETVRLVIDRVEGGVADTAEIIGTITDDDDPGQGPPELYFSVFGSSSLAEGSTFIFKPYGEVNDFTTDVLLEFKIIGDNGYVVENNDIESITVTDFRRNGADPNGYYPNINTYTNQDFALVFLGVIGYPMSSQTRIEVKFADDSAYEGDRSFHIEAIILSGNAQAAGSANEGFSRGIILENDAPPPPLVTLYDSSALEGEIIRIPVELERAAVVDTTLAYLVEHGATDGDDLPSTSGTVIILAGQSVGFIDVATSHDLTDEGSENFTVSLTSVVAGEATIDPLNNSATGIIANNDHTLFSASDDTVVIHSSMIAPVYDGLAGDDHITGTASANSIRGGGGNDTLFGGAGDDILDGGADLDQLFGGAGNDRITYDASDDLANVLGGADMDTLIVLGGATPFGFDLTAHEFEIAEHSFGIGGGGAQRDTYTSSWQRSDRTIWQTDGSRSETHFDPGGLLDTVQVDDNFGTSGTYVSQTGFYDAGGRWAAQFNIAGANDYFYNYYDAADQLDYTTGRFDTGLTFLQETDQGDLNDWSSKYAVNTAANVADYQYDYYDDGTRSYLEHDQDDVEGYLYQYTFYDAAGVATHYFGKNDDGSDYYFDL